MKREEDKIKLLKWEKALVYLISFVLIAYIIKSTPGILRWFGIPEGWGNALGIVLGIYLFSDIYKRIE